MNKTLQRRGKKNDMTDYQVKRQKDFFTAYPLQSLRAAVRMGNMPVVAWKERRQHEIDTLKTSKGEWYQKTGRWY